MYVNIKIPYILKYIQFDIDENTEDYKPDKNS